jgi:hypothetical protein
MGSAEASPREVLRLYKSVEQRKIYTYILKKRCEFILPNVAPPTPSHLETFVGLRRHLALVLRCYEPTRTARRYAMWSVCIYGMLGS